MMSELGIKFYVDCRIVSETGAEESENVEYAWDTTDNSRSKAG